MSSSNLTRWEIRARTVVRTREELGPLRAQRSPTGLSPSRGSLTPTPEDGSTRHSPTFLLECRSFGRPTTPLYSQATFRYRCWYHLQGQDFSLEDDTNSGIEMSPGNGEDIAADTESLTICIKSLPKPTSETLNCSQDNLLNIMKSSVNTPSPQILYPECRPTVKFTVEEEEEWNGGEEASGGGGEEASGVEGGGGIEEGGGDEGPSANNNNSSTRAKQIFMSHQPSPLPLPSTPPPYQAAVGPTPSPATLPDGRSLGEAEGDDDEDEEEDYSASVSAILHQRRQASTRRSRRRGRRTSSPFSPLSPDGASLAARHDRRRSSVFTTSSADTGFSVAVAEEPRVLGGVPIEEVDRAVAEGVQEASSPTAVAAATQQQIFENLRLHKEVRESVRLQPWPMRRKVRLVQRAKAYVRRHEGELQERLAHGKSTRDLLARANLFIVKHWQHLKRELLNAAGFLIPWEHRIKEIESHFGSVVASYFTFLRWLFWVNVVIATLLIAFVIIPELLVGREHGGWDDRKEMLPEEKTTATNLLTLWDFEGALKYSPMFYGFYSNREKTDGGYRIPFAYFMTGLAVYVYSFVATLRKMAENSRMSKLSEKDDECVFSWKLFTGWDYMIGNAETAHNRVASIILGFKEVLLEEREKQKDRRNWKVIGLRVLVNLLVLFLLASSAYAVVLVVRRSTKATTADSWWRQNEITVVLSLISVAFPILFELIGFLESYHPRKQLRIQLARIMVLNLLNLYTLIFALFGKISNMTRELQELKPNNATSNAVPNIGGGNVSSTSIFHLTSISPSNSINTTSNLLSQKDYVNMSTGDETGTSEFVNTSLLLSISPQCFKELVRCIVEATTFQNSSHINTEKEMISVLVNVTATLIPLFLEIFLHSNFTQTLLSPLNPSSSTFSSSSETPLFDETISTDSLVDDFQRISSSLSTSTSLPSITHKNYSKETTQELFTDTTLIGYSKSLTLEEFYTSSDDAITSKIDMSFSSETDSSTVETDSSIAETDSSTVETTHLPITSTLDPVTTGTDDLLTTFSSESLSTFTINEDNNTNSAMLSSEDDDVQNWTSLFQDDDSNIYLNGSTEDEETSEVHTVLFNTDKTIGNFENESTTAEENDYTNKSSTINELSSEQINTKSLFAEMLTSEQLVSDLTTSFDISRDPKDEPFTSIPDETVTTNKAADFLDDDYDPTMPIDLIRSDIMITEKEINAPSQLEITSIKPILEAKINKGSGLQIKETLNQNGNFGYQFSPTVDYSEKEFKHISSQAQSFLLGHIVTIILTAAILVSKEEDNISITKKLFKKDEKRISELIGAWKQSLVEEQKMNGTKGKMGEQCFAMYCKKKGSEYTSGNVSDSKYFLQNCNQTLCSSEDLMVTATPSYVSPTAQMNDQINKSTTELKGYPVTPKSTLSYHSNLDTRRKLRRLCWETMFGQELVKLTVMDLVLTIASTLLVDFIRALFVRIMNNCWCWDLEKQFPQYGDFKIAENILHLVYNQGMVWMGMFFSPGLPALNIAKLAVVLYVRSWVVLTCNVPHDVVFRASRSNNFYLALLLTMLFLCALPVGYALVWVEPSWHCGPFAGRDRISSLFTSSVRAAFPDTLRPVLDYVASPALVIPLLVLLVLVVAYLLALAAALREANDDLRAQLRRERTEERRKMFQIANGRGRKGRRAKGGMPRDGRAPSDDASGMGGIEDFVEGEVAGEGDATVKEAEEVTEGVTTGWRSLLGRIANLRTVTSKITGAHQEKTKQIDGDYPLKGVKTPETASKEEDILPLREEAAAETCDSQPHRTPSIETTRRQIRSLDDMEEGTAAPNKSSSSSRGDRDSPSSACWSGDIPLIRIVRTADEGSRTPQQAQPQQPTGQYDNAAMDETSESNPTEINSASK